MAPFIITNSILNYKLIKTTIMAISKFYLLIFFLISNSVLSYGQSGILDVSFGNGGKVHSDFGASTLTRFRAIAIQSDGKIILAGSNRHFLTVDNYPGYALARFNIDGSIDNSFGSNGYVEIDFNDDAFSEISLLAFQSDGRIIAAGNSGMCRFSVNGVLDLSFGISNGFIGYGAGQSTLSSLLILPDNKIIVAGDGHTYGTGGYGLTKYNSDGTPDPSYGSASSASFGAGPATAAGNSVSFLADALLQNDGKIICAGHYIYQPDGSLEQIAIFRTLADGSWYDNTFAGIGIGGDMYGETLTFTENDLLSAAKLLPDGKILVIGETNNSNGSNQNMIIAKINSNGTLDTSFGNNGKTTFSTSPAYEQPYSLDIQSDGKILITSLNPAAQGSYNLLRLNQNGTFDNTFGTNGVVSGTLGLTSYDNGNLVKIQSDGKIIVAGTGVNSSSAPYTSMSMARYLPGTIVGISENVSLQDQISLLPNPTSELFTISSEKEHMKSIIILNSAGNIVQINEINALSAEVNIQGLSSGLYLLKITTNSGTISKRIVKN
jgi:uncharacterized delta-60 repeat protein